MKTQQPHQSDSAVNILTANDTIPVKFKGNANGSRIKDNRLNESSLYLETDVQMLGGAKETKHQSIRKLPTSDQMIQDPKFEKALDIFMLLNRNNDGYVQYDETDNLRKVILGLPDSKDRGKIKDEQSFKDIFDSLKLFNINVINFKNLLDLMQVDLDKVRDGLYDYEYHGFFNRIFCQCFKCCCKRIRRKMVQGKLKELDQDQKIKKKKYTDMFTITKQIQASVVEGLDLFTDVVLLNQIYWEGMKPENADKDSYKIVALIMFISICSCFLIAYSSIVNMLLYNGVYEPAQIKRQGYCMIFFRLLFLSFIGPFYFVFIEITHKIMNIFSFLGLLCGKSGYQSIKNFFLGLIKRVFGLHQEQCEGLEIQRGIVQLCFESIPMIILQILIRYKVLDLGKTFDNKESSNALFFSLMTTILSVIFVLLNVRIESKAFDEDLLEYTLNCFKARQQWIPFIHQIRRQELKQAINYSELYCEYPRLTGKSGAYKLFMFRFTDISLQKLTSELVKWDNRVTESIHNELEYLQSDDENEKDKNEYSLDEKEYGSANDSYYEGGKDSQGNQMDFQIAVRDRYIMDFGGSVEFCTLNMLLHFYNLAPKNKINIKLTAIDWQRLLQNAMAMHLIQRPKSKSLTKYQAMTLSGQHLIWVCVDDEKVADFVLDSKTMYRKALKVLYEYVIVQRQLFGKQKELYKMDDGDEKKQAEEDFQKKLKEANIEIDDFEMFEVLQKDIPMLINLRKQKNADMQYVSNLMISISKRLKQFGKKVRDSMQSLNGLLSDTTQIFDSIKKLKADDDLQKNFKEMVKTFDSVPGQDIIDWFESLDMPLFYNPNSWILEECFKMLIQQDTDIEIREFDGCELNVKDNFDETLLIHAVKTFKNRSLELLIKKGADLEIANDRGMTPIGQAIVSKNVKALDLLLENGADIHRNCLVDLSISSKTMKPLHYIAKYIRINGVDKEFEDIIEQLSKHNVSVKELTEKTGILRQFCRLASSKYSYSESVEKALTKLKFDDGVDLLNFTDQKKNNFMTISLKKYPQDTELTPVILRILNAFNQDKDGQKYCYELEDVKEELSKQLSAENAKGLSALGEAFSSLNRMLVIQLSSSFIDKYDKQQEQQAIEYIYMASNLSYGFFTRNRFSDYYIDIKRFFEDWEAVMNAVYEMAISDPLKSEYTLFNLAQAHFAQEKLQHLLENKKDFYGGGPDRHNSSEKKQVVNIKNYDDLQKGKFMRVQPTNAPDEANPFADNEQPSSMIEIQEHNIASNAKSTLNASASKELVGGDSDLKLGQRKQSSASKRKNTLSSSVSLNVSIKHEKVKIKQNGGANKYFEIVFNIFLELIALFDMIGDIYALVIVYQQGHIAWFVISVFTMISPFYVCYVPLLTFQKEQAEKIENDSFFQKFLAFLSLTPLILIDLLLMDLIYIINSVIITPLVFIFTCGRLNLEVVEGKIDKIYNYLFGMSDMDIKGFRRLRTISQLTFESFPQILLQIRILIYTLEKTKQNDELGSDVEAILISLACALVHAVFEVLFLHLEAKSCKTTKIHYTIVCFNARFGWIPFIHYFSSVSGHEEPEPGSEEAENQDKMDMDLNYEGMKSSLCGIVFQMKFKFSDATCRVLTNSLSNLLIEKIPEKRYNLKIGESLNEVSFYSIIDLVQMAYMRVNLDISEVDLNRIINDPHNKDIIHALKNPEKKVRTKNDYSVIQQTVAISQGDVLKALLDIDGIDLAIEPSLLEIAEENDDYEMMKILVTHQAYVKHRDLISDLSKVSNGYCRFRQWIRDKSVNFLCALLNSNRLVVTEQYQYYFIKRLLDELQKNNLNQAGFLMSFLFGSDLPLHLLRGDGRDDSMRNEDKNEVLDLIEKYHNFFRSHKKKLSDVVHFCMHQSGDELENFVLPTSVVSCFAVLRESIIRHWPLDHIPFSGKMIGGKYNPVDLCHIDHEDKLSEVAFKQVCLMISENHFEVENLTPKQVYECDRVVRKLRLDKFRDRYFARSRRCDQTHQYYDIEVTELPQISLDVCQEQNKKGFWESVVIADNRRQYHGMTCRIFDYTIPADVLAIKSFKIYYEFFGGSINMTHCSPTHQSFEGISLHDDNKWYAETYTEEFEDDDPAKRAQSKGGYKDILANATGGDSIQLWLETNGYAFAKNVRANFEVYKKIETSLLNEEDSTSKAKNTNQNFVSVVSEDTNKSNAIIPLLQMNNTEILNGNQSHIKDTDPVNEPSKRNSQPFTPDDTKIDTKQ